MSSICYFRSLFPENCFSTKQYGHDLRIHTLQGAEKDNDGNFSIENEEAFLVTQWLEKGVFKALDLEYVSSMVFAIYCKHPKTQADLLLETYEFKVTYQTDDKAAALNNILLTSKDSVREQAGRFVRALMSFFDTLEELPGERWITIQLHVSTQYKSKTLTMLTLDNLNYLNSIRSKLRRSMSLSILVQFLNLC